MQFRTRDLAILALASSAVAQTSTSCNPTEKTCPSDAGSKKYNYSVDFTKGASDDWTMTYNTATYTSNGAGFSISKDKMAPTMQSSFYVFFGKISATMRAAPGTGIVSCFILESDDLDEIDWEWLGGEDSSVETNYFGKGNTTSYDRATYVNVTDAINTFHTYTLEWTDTQTNWIIDGNVVRTLQSSAALGGKNYPQTPMRIKLGNWIAQDTGAQGTIDWAGGETDFSKGPFTMYVKSIEIENYNPASTYTYGDLTGDWQSIKMSNSSSSSTTTTTTTNKGSGSSISNSTVAGSSSSSSGSNSTTSVSGSSSGSSSSSSASGSSTAATELKSAAINVNANLFFVAAAGFLFYLL